jgi:hypothetical protein
MQLSVTVQRVMLLAFWELLDDIVSFFTDLAFYFMFLFQLRYSIILTLITMAIKPLVMLACTHALTYMYLYYSSHNDATVFGCYCTL